MDMQKDHIAIYLATLQGVIDLIEAMSAPTVKKIKLCLKEEISKMRQNIDKEHGNGRQN